MSASPCFVHCGETRCRDWGCAKAHTDKDRRLILASEPVVLELSRRDARALYDHTGTMPSAPGSWSNNVRSLLSEVLTRKPEETQ